MEKITGNPWWIPNSSGKVSSYKSDITLTTYKPVDTLDKPNLISIDKNLNSQNSLKSQITVVKKGYTSDQRAVIELAKEAKAQGGLKAEEAKTLQKWANEYGVPNHGPEIHPNRPGAASIEIRRISMLVILAFDENLEDIDIVDIPENINNLEEIQEIFFKWLFNENTNHNYWVFKNGIKKYCSYDSEAFVEWFNKNLNYGKMKIIEKHANKPQINLPILYF